MHDTSAGINISDLGPYYTEIKYFYDCLKQGKEIERAPLSEGIKSVLLGLEELKAAKNIWRKTEGGHRQMRVGVVVGLHKDTDLKGKVQRTAGNGNGKLPACVLGQDASE